jgi:hypothetical protein
MDNSLQEEEHLIHRLERDLYFNAEKQPKYFQKKDVLLKGK